MHPRRIHIHRIPPLRPLRPPNQASPVTSHRHGRIFTTSASLLRITNTSTRPQLPFLTPSFSSRQPVFNIRPLSTEQKANIKYHIKLGVYWTAVFWITAGGLAIGYYVLREDWLDRQYPSPVEFNWVARTYWRNGRHEEEEDLYGVGLTDWAVVGKSFIPVYTSCEGGMELKPWAVKLPQNENWDRTIPGLDIADIEREPVSNLTEIPVEKIGFDVSSKSEPFIRAYFHALMSMAKTAEMTVNLVRDKKRHLLFPADQMIGPSNPTPTPTWRGSPPAPLEEDCGTPYDPPDLWYTRILTTGGLSRDQRVAAGLAYASWAEYSGDISQAKALYSWCLKLAASIPDPTSPSTTTSAPASSSITTPQSPAYQQLVDLQTAIIPHTAPYTTPSILATSTAIASHLARTGSLAPALSIYLSVLRARRASPPSLSQYPPPEPDYSLTSPSSILLWLRSLPFKSHMPPPPPPGDAPFLRTAASKCEDAAMMNYIGEILFASASGGQGRRDALGWTRDAVAIAEEGMGDKRLGKVAKRVCTECLGSGLENWHKMVGVLAREEESGKVSSSEEASHESRSWWNLWSSSGTEAGKSGGEAGVDGVVVEGQWKKEEEMVALKRAKYQDAKLMMQLNRQISTKSNWFVA